MKMVDGKAVYLEPEPESKSSIVGGYILMLAIVLLVVGIYVFGHYSNTNYPQPAEVAQSK